MIADLQVRLLLPEGGGDEFWSAALGWPLAAGATRDVATFSPPGGDSFIQRWRVTEMPRVQVAFEVDDVVSETGRLLRLGATADRGGPGLRSPGGWPVGLVEARPRRRPAAQRWPTGHRSRLVQVCIDSPPALHDHEVAFWAGALGWDWRDSDSPEFAGKLVRPGTSVRILLHRLGPDDGGTVVRAHLDLGTDDLESESTRLVQIGAERLWTGRGWLTLRDPAGMLFCVTENSPDTP